MSPIEFPGVNVTFAKDQPEYRPLPAMVSNDGVTVTTVWELTDEEVRQVLLEKRIIHTQMVFGQPPQPINMQPVTVHF